MLWDTSNDMMDSPLFQYLQKFIPFVLLTIIGRQDVILKDITCDRHFAKKIENNLRNYKILSGTFIANFVPLTTLWSCGVNWPKVATACIKEIQNCDIFYCYYYISIFIEK